MKWFQLVAFLFMSFQRQIKKGNVIGSTHHTVNHQKRQQYSSGKEYVRSVQLHLTTKLTKLVGTFSYSMDSWLEFNIYKKEKLATGSTEFLLSIILESNHLGMASNTFICQYAAVFRILLTQGRSSKSGLYKQKYKSMHIYQRPYLTQITWNELVPKNKYTALALKKTLE